MGELRDGNATPKNKNSVIILSTHADKKVRWQHIVELHNKTALQHSS